MKSSVENLDPTRVKVTVEVPYEELKSSVDAAYREVAAQVNVPGFRKGKVPPRVIDQRVGRGAVIEHAVNEGLDGFYREAVSAHEVRIVGRPNAEIIEWPNEKDFSGDLKVEIEVDVRPDIELPEYEGMTVTVDAAETSPEPELASSGQTFWPMPGPGSAPAGAARPTVVATSPAATASPAPAIR